MATFNTPKKRPTMILHVSDLEALEHARRCVDSHNSINPHALDSRALSELDRIIDAAKRAG